MYFNVDFKEMKIGAQQEAWQCRQLCAARCRPGCTAVAWQEAAGTGSCSEPCSGCSAATRHPLLFLSLQACPAGEQKRGEEGAEKEEKGILALTPGITALEQLLVHGEER